MKFKLSTPNIFQCGWRFRKQNRTRSLLLFTYRDSVTNPQRWVLYFNILHFRGLIYLKILGSHFYTPSLRCNFIFVRSGNQSIRISYYTPCSQWLMRKRSYLFHWVLRYSHHVDQIQQNTYLTVIQRSEHSTLWSSWIKGLVWFRVQEPPLQYQRSATNAKASLPARFRAKISLWIWRGFFSYLFPSLDKPGYSDMLKKPPGIRKFLAQCTSRVRIPQAIQYFVNCFYLHSVPT